MSLYVGILKARIVLGLARWAELSSNQSGRPAKSYYAFYQLARLTGVEQRPAGTGEGGRGLGGTFIRLSSSTINII